MNKKLKYLITSIIVIVLALGLSVTASAETLTEAEEITEATVFDKLYTEVSEYAGEILCALAFIGSVVLAFAYKKGLMPIVKSSLVTIGNAMSKMKDSVNKNAERGEEMNRAIASGLDGAVKVIQTLGERIDALEKALTERLADKDETAREREALSIIMTSQIDMLYEIFMSASLPQYQKDAIGERIAEMKGALAKNGDRG